MQVFKTTLRLVTRFPVYLILYIVLFGLLGVLITSSIESTASSSDQIDQVSVRPKLAVIDRDQSAVSTEFTEFLSSRSTLVEVEDSTKALQDATAQNLASYIVIIPEDFGEGFIHAARTGDLVPTLGTIVNYTQSSSILMDLMVSEYLSALRNAALFSPDAPTNELLDTAASIASVSANVEAATVLGNNGTGTQIVRYFQWISYPLTMGLIVLIGVIFVTFQSGELRRRNLCSPLSSSQMNIRVALGCLSLVLMTWIYLVALSLLPFIGGIDVLANDPSLFALLALAALIYAFVPFAIGFLLSQIGFKELALNGLSNILAISFAFISGVFLGSAALLGENIQALAHFIPTYWYSEALQILRDGVLNESVLTTYLSNLGIVALFALAIFTVALFIGRYRAQSADAGGNPAAD